MKIATLFSSALILLAAMISCGKDTIVLGNCCTMGTVLSDNAFRTDENLLFNIVEGMDCSGIEAGARIFVTCDVLSAVPGNDSEFEVKVSSISEALNAEYLAETPDLMVWKDAMAITDAWISGGYLNMYCAWIHKRNSIFKHRTGLCPNTSKELGDTLAFTVYHDGQGEGFYGDAQDVSDLEVEYGIVTFPIGEFIPAGNVTIKLTFKWHKSDGQMLYPETEEHSIDYSFCPEASAALSSPSTKAMISPLATLLP